MVDTQQRITTFSQQLSCIPKEDYRIFAERCLSDVPDYFFSVPASSSGKYHPQFALGEGGLVRHVQAAMNIFHMLTDATIDEYYMARDSANTNGYDKATFDSEALVALLFHDCFKQGTEEEWMANPKERRTKHEHPLLAMNFILEEGVKYRFHDPEAIVRIARAISTHMGIWTISNHSLTVLPSPWFGDWLCKIVHICDFLASRKELEYNFNPLPREERANERTDP